MQTIQRRSAPISSGGQTPEQIQSAVALEKLAAFIYQRQLVDRSDVAHDRRRFIEIKGSDKEVADSLGISVVDLRRNYVLLAKSLVQKRHGPNRIEIVNSAKLAEFAKVIEK
jgi:hypothetical protein